MHALCELIGKEIFLLASIIGMQDAFTVEPIVFFSTLEDLLEHLACIQVEDLEPDQIAIMGSITKANRICKVPKDVDTYVLFISDYMGILMLASRNDDNTLKNLTYLIPKTLEAYPELRIEDTYIIFGTELPLVASINEADSDLISLDKYKKIANSFNEK